ncbi:MAG TPA: dienelactone hydrolase family protein [Steroidobacteraceae bacterium]|nr:dienelactone hydrolase family protein [Steroidobacteraceae bacterium]
MPTIEYSDGSTTFEGYIAVPQLTPTPRACILIAHAWDGLNIHWIDMAEHFAARGFVALAIDVYGKGIRGRVDGDNSELMNPLLENRGELLKRLRAAFEFAIARDDVDEDRVVMLGHCFGGLCALDLARASPKGLRGAIAVHSPLTPSDIFETNKISASVLVLHGWADPVAPPHDVLTFAAEMSAAGADWQLHAYGHAMHAFTFVGADIPALGIKYDANAHRRSQHAIEQFLAETLGRP